MIIFINLGSNCCITYQLNQLKLRTEAYPFDWTDISLKQLIEILQNDFIGYDELEHKKISNNHPLFNEDQTKTSDSSAILTNKYKIKFAHEISTIYEIEDFKFRLQNRITRFKQLDNSNNINFIRIELSKINDKWTENILNLIVELKKYVPEFQLTLLICSDNIFENVFPPFVKIIKFNNFSPDWKMDHLNWIEIFNK
jgi:hypothetical protein